MRRGYNYDNGEVVFDIPKREYKGSNRRRYDYSQYGKTEGRKLHTNNSSGYQGVSWYGKTGQWRASVSVNGVRISLGLFSTPEKAHGAVLQAKLPMAKVVMSRSRVTKYNPVD